MLKQTVFPYPKIQPIKMETRDLPWYKRTWTWLVSSRQYILLEEYRLFLPQYGVIFIIPKEFIFDDASIPKIFRPLLSPMGILLIPALIHDFAYKYKGYLFINSKGEIKYEEKDKMTIDNRFFDMINFVNGMIAPAIIAWAGVQFGILAWSNHRRNNANIAIDYPEYKLQ